MINFMINKLQKIVLAYLLNIFFILKILAIRADISFRTDSCKRPHPPIRQRIGG